MSAGLRVKNLWDQLGFNLWVYDVNLLGLKTWYDPDMFNDWQSFNQAQPKPGWSFFMEAVWRI